MEKCRERILKRLKSQYKAAIITSILLWIFSSIIAIAPGEVEPGIVIFLLIGTIILVVVLPMLFKYKKSINTIISSNPTICTVTGSDMKYISSKRSYQVAYFIYDGKECYGFDYDKQLDEIEPGQQLYVWKITEKRYEITHIE